MRVLQAGELKNNHSELYEFTHGVDVDAALAPFEIRVQKAWANALLNIQLIKKSEYDGVCSALDEALLQMNEGSFEWRIEDEDIHMNLERFLTSRLGEIGKKIHLGRSRNDLIATTLRLYVVAILDECIHQVAEAIDCILFKANEWSNVLVPGMTHLQNGQPIRFASVLASYGWALLRDLQKMRWTQSRSLEVMPLGAAALAGTTLPVNLEAIAQELGFRNILRNSYDSVGDRDFILDACHSFGNIGVHLSRLSEDCIFWSSTAVGLIRLPQDWSTGSSIMPNKRNPDIPELIRAKSSHWISSSSQAQVLMKGLPSSYNTDLHELKRVFQINWLSLKKCLYILPKFLKELEVNNLRAKELLTQGHLLATDIANFLTTRGMSFRDAYLEVSRLVREAQAEGLSVEEFLRKSTQTHPLLKEVASHLTFESSVEARCQAGGTALARVLESLQLLKDQKEALVRMKSNDTIDHNKM